MPCSAACCCGDRPVSPPVWLVERPGGCVLVLHIQPGAGKAGVVGLHGDALKIRIDAPPVDGKANAALLAFLAARLGVARSSLDLLSGDTGRRKRVLVSGLGADEIQSRLA